MRWGAAILAIGLIVVLFALTTTDSPPEDLATLVAAPVETTAARSAVSTTSRPPFVTDHSEALLVGVLPDGTWFSVAYEPGIHDTITGIHAAIVIDVDGQPMAVGTLDFFGSWTEVPIYQGGVYRPSRSGVTIDFYDEILELLGDDAEDLIRSAIRAGSVPGYPTLELDSPFRWATDQELPVQMEVTTESFSVRRGCGPLAVACSGNGAVQVIPLDRLYAPAPVWMDAEVYIEAPDASRPVWDDSYLDPGPLSPRAFADVMWTGTEMIVWGGSDRNARPNQADGAAFDPERNEWRTLAAAPVHPRAATRAVLADDQMIVVTRDVTLAYDITADTWSEIAEGRIPPMTPGGLIWNGTSVYMWSDELLRLDLTRGQWDALPDPPVDVGLEHWMKELRVLGSSMVAVGTRGSCEGRSMALWRNPDWLSLGETNLSTTTYADCSTPRQTVSFGDQLIVWSEQNAGSLLLRSDSTVMWSGMGRPPLRGTEGAAGALVMESRMLIPEYGFAAIYDRDTATWSRRVIPGYGTEWDMVWTGEEVLMWGVPLCCVDLGAQVDAWRWTPPDS